VAICPFIVAGDVDDGLPELAEHGDGIAEGAVVATGAAILDVAIVEREFDICGIDAVEQRGYFWQVVGLGVGHVAPQTEVELFGMGRHGHGECGKCCEGDCGAHGISPFCFWQRIFRF